MSPDRSDTPTARPARDPQPAADPDRPAAHRSGFASFVGRPNAGKSTLTNALVGSKVVITSSKPQTTRTVVRGIVHRPDAQLILVDTPGLHRPRTLLGERLNDLVKTTLAEVDVVAVCFPANEKIGPGDRFIVREMAKVRRTIKVAIATKTDLATGGADRPAPARHPEAGRRDRHRVGRDRARVREGRRPGQAARGPAGRRCCRRAPSSTRTASSATRPRRPSSPS